MPVDDKELRDSLHSRFRELVGAPEGDEVAYHLADLHGGFAHAARMIELVAGRSEVLSGDALRAALTDLAGELFEHIHPHIERVQPGLEKLVADLFDEAERRGDI
jgi:hypothetical protein